MKGAIPHPSVLRHYANALIPPLLQPGFLPDRFDLALRHFASLLPGKPMVLSISTDATAVRRVLKSGASRQAIGLTSPYNLVLPDTYHELLSVLDGREKASSVSVCLVSAYGRPDLAAYPLAVLPESGCSAATTARKYHIIYESFRLRGAVVLSMAADGADLSAMLSYRSAPANQPTFDIMCISPGGQLTSVRLRAFRCALQVSCFLVSVVCDY
jgi:hypothetical protein